MAIPITIKKRKMSFKQPETGAPDEAPVADIAEDTAVDSGVSGLPARLNAPHAPARPAPSSNTAFGILAILATGLFVILVLLQWIEWSDINTAFPRPLQTGELVTPTN
jgi:hypothetical protein